MGRGDHDRGDQLHSAVERVRRIILTRIFSIEMVRLRAEQHEVRCGTNLRRAEAASSVQAAVRPCGGCPGANGRDAHATKRRGGDRPSTPCGRVLKHRTEPHPNRPRPVLVLLLVLVLDCRASWDDRDEDEKFARAWNSAHEYRYLSPFTR